MCLPSLARDPALALLLLEDARTFSLFPSSLPSYRVRYKRRRGIWSMLLPGELACLFLYWEQLYDSYFENHVFKIAFG